MPLPMVHLPVAVQVHLLACSTLTPEFVLGSLAPDAIHMRLNSNRVDKSRVHLFVSDISEPEVLEKIHQLRISESAGQDTVDPFIEGYAAHLLTDYWWGRNVIRQFAENLPQGTSPEDRRTWYYRETDQVDFNLYHHASWQQTVWDLLAAASAPDFLPYLTSDEIDHWRHRTLEWFVKLKQEPGIVPMIITDQIAADFIERTAFRIYPYLKFR